jgi:hypothetical protein
MKSKALLVKLAASLVPLITVFSFAESSHAQTPKFFCGMGIDGKGPATFVNTFRYGNLELIRWQDAAFGSYYTPQKRCEDVSARFQKFYEKGLLEYIRTATFKGQPVLCVATDKGGACLPNGLLITLKRGTDPKVILEQIKDSQALTTGKPIYLSENDVISVVHGETYLDITILSGEGNAESERGL